MDFTNFLTMVSTEFHRYLMENETIAERIPSNALIIFQIEGENDFNLWHKELSLRNREKDQPVHYIRVKKWRQHSTIEDVSLIAATA
jgi:hypothetical protein